MPEVPRHSIETLRELPVQVTWRDEGFTGSMLEGSVKKVYGEFFDIDLQGLTADDLAQHEIPPDSPATFSGSIDYKDNGDKFLSAGTLSVAKDYRGNQLGERLTKALASIAAEQGCIGIEVGFSHPAALRIFRKIFGDERIHFTKKDSLGSEVDFNISPKRAGKVIAEERQEVIKWGVQHGIFKHQPKSDDEILPGAINGVGAWVDMRGFDTSDFEPLVQTGAIPISD